MARFKFTITANGPNGCDRKAQPGDKLYNRCGKMTCPDCLAHDFMLTLKAKGMPVSEATFTHQPETEAAVVDDMMNNVRLTGSF